MHINKLKIKKHHCRSSSKINRNIVKVGKSVILINSTDY